MLYIGEQKVVDSGTEYAVFPFEGLVIDCDTREEAEHIADLWGVPVQHRRFYITEWVPLLQQ